MVKSINTKLSKSKKIFTSIYVPSKERLKTLITEQFKTLLDEEDDDTKFTKDIRKKLGEPHLFDYKVVEGVVKKFGLANAVVDKIADFAIGPTMSVISNDEELQKDANLWLEETDFRAFLRPWLKDGLIKGNGYIEIAGLQNEDVEAVVKNVNANTIFIQRDKKAKIISFNQFIGKDFRNIQDKDIIKLDPNEIGHLTINKIGNSAYGMGIIFSSLTTINDFLMAQSSIHKLVKRKGAAPIWVKLGNIETDDIPQQADIDNFGDKLQFMDECTEWVTGPNVDMKVLDFGNIGDKFTTVLDNDYKLLSFSFQVPETILGAGNVPEGLAEVQMDAFNRRITSIQDEMSLVVKKILKRVLKNPKESFKIVWGELNQKDKFTLMKTIKEIMSVNFMSPGMRNQVEGKMAELLDIDFEKVKEENEKAKKELEDQEQPNGDVQPGAPQPGTFKSPSQPNQNVGSLILKYKKELQKIDEATEIIEENIIDTLVESINGEDKNDTT